MNDQSNTGTGREQDLDLLLKESFSSATGLSDDFESGVMQRIDTHSPGWFARHVVFLVMCTYWVAALTISGWAINEVEPVLAASGISLSVLLLLVGAICLLPVWMMLRQFQISLGQMFLRTLQ